MNNIEKLLQQINAINKTFDAIYSSTGSYFNIFDITNMNYKEVHICQVIRELIDPKGSHFQGDIYLRLFVKYVLRLEEQVQEEDYKKVTVTSEHVIDRQRRIDVYIKIGKKIAIPIEAKIYACDQENQCHDYYEYAKKDNVKEAILYYLTLDGHEPDEVSTKGMTDSDKKAIEYISFKNDIIKWLEECLRVPATIKLASVREIILQLIDVLKRITGQLEDNKEMEVKQIITESVENFKSANEMAKGLEVVRRDLENRLFRKLDERITEDYGLIRLSDKYDFERVKKKGESYRGICYEIAPLGQRGFSIGLRLTIEELLYSELCLIKSGEIFWEDISKVVKREDLLTKKVGEEDSINSIAWKWIVDDEYERPNFNTYNHAYCELIKDEAIDRFVDAAMENVEELLSCLKKKYRVEKHKK